MSKRKGRLSGSVERTLRLLNGLENNSLKKVQERLNWERERGENSTLRVIDALRQLKEVQYVTRVDSQKKLDEKGVDLVVTLHEVKKRFRVQVKSSKEGVASFIERQANGQYSREIIPLNGQQSIEKIQHSFLVQITRQSRQ